MAFQLRNSVSEGCDDNCESTPYSRLTNFVYQCELWLGMILDRGKEILIPSNPTGSISLKTNKNNNQAR